MLEELIKYFQGLWPGMETAEQCNTDMHFTPPAIMRLAHHFANWQKQQMLKDAMEGEVVELGETYKSLAFTVGLEELNAVLQPLGVKDGDKVKIVIIPDKEG